MPALMQARAASWRIMKKPLIGSFRSALSTTRLSCVAQRLKAARDESQLPMPPLST